MTANHQDTTLWKRLLVRWGKVQGLTIRRCILHLYHNLWTGFESLTIFRPPWSVWHVRFWQRSLSTTWDSSPNSSWATPTAAQWWPMLSSIPRPAWWPPRSTPRKVRPKQNLKIFIENIYHIYGIILLFSYVNGFFITGFDDLWFFVHLTETSNKCHNSYSAVKFKSDFQYGSQSSHIKKNIFMALVLW